MAEGGKALGARVSVNWWPDRELCGDMWCFALTGPCCCGPCQIKITTGAKIVFFANILLMFLLIILSIIMLDSNSALVTFFCKFFENYISPSY